MYMMKDTKRILCYGDSNTWGYMPVTCGRYSADIRWTGRLRKLLPGCEIIEEGMNGRTSVWEDPIDGYMSGKNYLFPCLKSHNPIDAVVLALGTNDMKSRFSLNAYDVAEGAGALVKLIQGFRTVTQTEAPAILLVRPAPMPPDMSGSPFFGIFDENSAAVSRRTLEPFKSVAASYGCSLLDAETCTEICGDGLHFTAAGHALFAKAAAGKLMEMFYD